MAPTIPLDLTIEGKLVLLRPPIPEDDVPLSEIFQDKETTTYLQFIVPEGGFTPQFLGGWRESFLNQVKEDKRVAFHIIKKKTGELVGNVGLRDVKLEEGTAELGIVVGSKYWRGGLATEAVYLTLQYGFEVLKLKHVRSRTTPKNEFVMGMCTSFGFQHQGIEIEDKLIPGKSEELAQFLLLSSEWEALKNKMETKIAQKLI